MLRKFVEGLVFGVGAAIAFFAIGLFGASMMFSTFATHRSSEADAVRTATRHIDERGERPFHELSFEEQIEQASVIAIAKYEPAEDGRMKAVLKEFLKKSDGALFHYDIGEEYRPSSYYPKEGTSYGDGIVIFFSGSPAMMRSSMTYYGDRIHSLGDMPMELFREKCGKGEA